MKLHVAMVAFLSLSCQKEPVSDSKFMTFEQEDKEGAEKFTMNMVEKVHYDSWNIAFGFYDNEGDACAGDYRKYHDGIKERITDTLLKWLSPISDKENLIIASGFNFINPSITGVSRAEGYWMVVLGVG